MECFDRCLDVLKHNKYCCTGFAYFCTKVCHTIFKCIIYEIKMESRAIISRIIDFVGGKIFCINFFTLDLKTYSLKIPKRMQIEQPQCFLFILYDGFTQYMLSMYPQVTLLLIYDFLNKIWLTVNISTN